MIIYSETKASFINDVFQSVTPSHIRSYQNSLRFMDTVLRDPGIPEDVAGQKPAPVPCPAFLA